MKLRVMITVLTVCCLAAGCHPDPFRSELKELDRIIAARQEYRDLFERKASPLRAGLDAALDDSIRFELEDSLRNYYLSFSLDSVERYTRKMAVSASTPRQRMKAELSEIRLVALKNMEMTALDLLSQIDTAAYDREGLRQTSAGILFSPQDLLCRPAHCLAAEIAFNQTSDLADPRHLHGRAVIQNDDRIRVRLRHPVDQFILASGQTHMCAVISFAFKRVRQTRDDHSLVTGARSPDRLLDQRFIRLFRYGIISLRIHHIALVSQGIHQALHADAVDMGAPATLKPRNTRELSDHCNLFMSAQRQDLFILQKHHALRGHLPRELVLCLKIPGSVRLPV